MGVETMAEHVFALRRELEPVTSEGARVGSLGPALFFMIVMLVISVVLCGVSSFIDNPKPRRTMRIVAFAIVFLPTIFFLSASYVDNSSQIISNRKTDATYKPRLITLGILVGMLALGIASFFAGESSPLLMHRQGRNIYTHKTYLQH